MLHLIHPALVHFSIALIVLGGVAEAWGLTTRRDALARWGGQLLLIALVSLVPTIVSGYLAANTVNPTGQGFALLDSHEQNGLIVLLLLLASQFWKAWCGGTLAGAATKLYTLLLGVIVLLTIYGAWLGGQMVYVHGVGVR